MTTVLRNCSYAAMMFAVHCTYLAAQENDTLRYAEWKANTESPTYPQRAEDIFFLHEHYGFAVTLDGDVWRMTGYSGGHEWHRLSLQYTNDSTGKKYYAAGRCIGFHKDGKRGYAGSLFTPTLFATEDSGKTWSPIVDRISGQIPNGLCGIHVVNDSVVYAVGRVLKPANVVKTVNGGKSWVGQVLDSNLAATLIDCYFSSGDTGIVVGGHSGDPKTGKALILRTEDGGNSWNVVHRGNRTGDQCWKIFPRTSTEWYVTIQTYAPVKQYLKTTDAGKTWELNNFGTDTSTATRGFPQGMIFVTEKRGFAGGWGTKYYETSDGGTTWLLQTLPYPINLNRFRKINDTTYYSAGVRLYKYSPNAVSVSEPADRIIMSAYPLPARELVTLQLSPDVEMAGADPVVSVMDVTGKIIILESVTGWEHPSVRINVAGLPNGWYSARISACGKEIHRTFLVAR